jgi:putative tricarboxylic transport membrane protein|tara:strand:+ start:15 stop:527 length:513 start_codon:yes stop_codon:yes gene_type:complete
MKFDKFSPNLLCGIISILFGIFIYYKIPTEVEKPVLIFGQSSSEIDPQIVPTIVALMFLIFGLYTAFYEKDAKISNSWPKVTKQILINISTTIICLILYSILFEYLGFVISSVLLILSLGTFMGNVNFKYLTVISILFPLSIFFLFVNVMHVFLPEFPFYEIRIGNFLIM